ncbi:hypothetical protein Chor_002453 [Crotalus horridus]
MAHFHPRYIPTLFIGEGLSGFIPAIFALAQGAGIASCVQVPAPTFNASVGNSSWGNVSGPGDSPTMETRYSPANFSSLVFFLLLSAMMFFCLVAFLLLNRQPKSWDLSTQDLCSSEITLHSIQEVPAGKEAPANWKGGPSYSTERELEDASEEDKGAEKVTYTCSKLVFIYFLVTWVNALTNGILPSVQSYSSLPYGNLAYHLVITWVSFTGALTYVKVMLGMVLRSCSHNALVWYGAVEQLGSLLGAVLMFPLVNVYHFFQSADFCSYQCPA